MGIEVCHTNRHEKPCDIRISLCSILLQDISYAEDILFGMRTMRFNFINTILNMWHEEAACKQFHRVLYQLIHQSQRAR